MIARVRDVSYWYPGGSEPALRQVSAEVRGGALALVAGPSAGGKSTFLRLFNGLVPQFHGGRIAGRVEVAGLDPARTPARRMASVAGMVFQEPEAQAIAETVEDEVAFGMEQAGIERAEMRLRLDRLLESLGIAHLRRRRLATLSGGERQRAALAAVLALEPRLLLLDEPASQLDHEGALSVIAALHGLRARGLTTLVVEHRLADLLPVVDGVLAVEGGAVRELTPRVAAAELAGVPAVCRLGRALGLGQLPLSVAEARAAMRGLGLSSRPSQPARCPGDVLLETRGLSVSYGTVEALAEVSLAVREGEAVALVGANGSGKTTLLRAIAGLAKPDEGELLLRGKRAPADVRARTATAGLVPQDPALALYRESVRDEIEETRRLRRLPGEGSLTPWGLDELADRHPRDLSVGQQQRVAIAAMLTHDPPLWLMDEPTRGADHDIRTTLAAMVKAHVGRGGAALVSTHDIETAATFATRVVGLEGGRVAFDLPASRAFAADGPCPTQIAQLVPGAVVVEDVL